MEENQPEITKEGHWTCWKRGEKINYFFFPDYGDG